MKSILRAYQSHRRLSSATLERVVALFIVFTIFLNGFVPRFTLGGRDREVLSQIMASQSAALLHFFSLSTLPVKLVNNLFSDEEGLPSRGRAGSPAGSRDAGAASSVEFSIINLDKKITVSRDCGTTGDGGGFASRHGSSPVLPAMPFGRAAFPSAGRFAVFLVLFFFLLPRSSVNEDDIAPVRMSCI